MNSISALHSKTCSGKSTPTSDDVRTGVGFVRQSLVSYPILSTMQHKSNRCALSRE